MLNCFAAPSQPEGLPEGKNIDGRSVEKPPIFNYSDLIGDEYEKKKETVMKFYIEDVARTSEFVNGLMKVELIAIYHDWGKGNENRAALDV